MSLNCDTYCCVTAFGFAFHSSVHGHVLGSSPGTNETDPVAPGTNEATGAASRVAVVAAALKVDGYPAPETTVCITE